MCSVSFVGSTYRDTFPNRWPGITVPETPVQQHIHVGVSKEDFDALKREVELLKEMLVAAKKYDEDNGEPDCAMDEKVEFLKRVAEFVGVDLSAVFREPVA